MRRVASRGSAPTARTASFLLITLVVLVAYVAGFRDMRGTAEVVGLAIGGMALVLLVRFIPWSRIPAGAQIAIPLAGVAFIMAMEALALPGHLDATVLLLGPVLWISLYGTMRQTALVTVVALCSAVGLQVAEGVMGNAGGVSDWAEVIALAAIAVLMAFFTTTSRIQAQTDDLTGLPNRRAWDSVLAAAMERARPGTRPLVVAIIDLDHFKRFNDIHGHAAGDDHLVQCAQAWSQHLRRGDVVARVGGEEFAVLIPGVDAQSAPGVLQRLMDAIPNGESCSVGAAPWNHLEGARHLTARADRALYQAKDAGRAQVVIAVNSTTPGRHRHAPRGPGDPHAASAGSLPVRGAVADS